MSKQSTMKVRSLLGLTTVYSLLFLTPTQAQYVRDIQIAGVYGAQSHVIDLNDQTYTTLNNKAELVQHNFPMLADRDMLFKVNLIENLSLDDAPNELETFSEDDFGDDLTDLPTDDEMTDVEVTVTLHLNGESTTLTLDPPAYMGLSESFDTGKATILHSFDDSYTTTIPKQWMKPGLKWELGWCHSPGDARHCEIDVKKAINIFHPVKMTINVFPFEFFGWSWRDVNVSIDALLEEMAQKLPISELVVRKPETDYYQVDEMLIPAQLGNPPRIINNRIMDGKLAWGNTNVDGTQWNHALYQAAGKNYNQYTASYMLIGMDHPGGKGKGATNGMTVSVMPRASDYGIAWHESLHMYKLVHWGQTTKAVIGTGVYPYIGEYLGIDAPNAANLGHIGPAWGYDAREQTFLPPTITQSNGYPRWRIVPEKQGSTDAHTDLGMLLTPLSDWSAFRTLKRFADRPAWFDATEDSYWVNESGWYRYNWRWKKFVLANVPYIKDGYTMPGAKTKSTRVYSILMQASTATEFFSKKNGVKIRDIEPIAKVYPPIGPYETNVQLLVDPRDEDSRNVAISKGMCNEKWTFCDFSVRVKRNGSWDVYALDRVFDWNAQAKAYENGEYEQGSFITVAINLPVSGGEVEEAQLLHTPNVLENAWPSTPPPVLATWKR